MDYIVEAKKSDIHITASIEGVDDIKEALAVLEQELATSEMYFVYRVTDSTEVENEQADA